jgi:UDP-3-O-[3-hydroxymyristoyl] glucosamine N-acyltransferase
MPRDYEPIFHVSKKIYVAKLFPNKAIKNNIKINNIKSLKKADQKDLTFYESKKYKNEASVTNASFCITSKNLASDLPDKTEKILVKNVLFELAIILKKLYPLTDIDYPDLSLNRPSVKKYKSVKFGNNVLIGKNVIIGNGTYIGSNTIIESNVMIGKNCVIGSGIIIKNTVIGENVVIQDNCKIGQKGFGFIPIKNKNIKIPHIGKVKIDDNVEIASSCTIDRGSVDDTEIGKNTYIDNQVHIAHNVKIGSNCMIAGQVGFAGSSRIGNNVSIGGQAGISGHLNIGNNVKIGGGSGVIKDIQDNQVVMGYPAISLKEFLKNKKK